MRCRWRDGAGEESYLKKQWNKKEAIYEASPLSLFPSHTQTHFLKLWLLEKQGKD